MLHTAPLLLFVGIDKCRLYRGHIKLMKNTGFNSRYLICDPCLLRLMNSSFKLDITYEDPEMVHLCAEFTGLTPGQTSKAGF